jgi:DNA-binding PadR family transcriptional regulator
LQKKPTWTIPDLVVLSLLAMRPMHGYEVNLELERRSIRDWAAISRPQVYYSLEKLAAAGFIRSTRGSEPASGPERTVFQTTAAGRVAMADALEGEHWAAHRDHPAFPTWIALSWLARPGVFQKQLRRRRKFVEQELARERKTLRAILEEVGHPSHEAVWMVTLVIEQFRTELKWLRALEREWPHRAAARHPRYVQDSHPEAHKPGAH